MPTLKKQDSSLETAITAIETANGYKTYYRDYDRMGIRNKIFIWIIILNLILSILSIILAIGIPFTVNRETEEPSDPSGPGGSGRSIMIKEPLLKNLTKMVKNNSQQITKLHQNLQKLRSRVREIEDKIED